MLQTKQLTNKRILFFIFGYISLQRYTNFEYKKRTRLATRPFISNVPKNYLTTETVLKDFEVKTQFMLPQTGHDIIVIFTCLDELDKKEYQRIYKYLDGVMLDLIWKKGTFIKSDPYFHAY